MLLGTKSVLLKDALGDTSQPLPHVTFCNWLVRAAITILKLWPDLEVVDFHWFSVVLITIFKERVSLGYGTFVSLHKARS